MHEVKRVTGGDKGDALPDNLPYRFCVILKEFIPNTSFFIKFRIV